MSRSKKFKKINVILLALYLIGSVAVIVSMSRLISNRGIDLAKMISNFLSLAARKDSNKNMPAQKNYAQINLYPQNPDTGDIINGSSMAKLQYNLSGPNFEASLTADKLMPNRAYTLIYFPEKSDNVWPRQGIICLGSGISDDKGNLTINNTSKPGSLPKPDDINAQRNGAQIILVNSSDVRCQENWDITGSWEINFNNDVNEIHSAYFIQKANSITGSGGYPAGATYTKSWNINIGSLNNNRIDLDSTMVPESQCLLQMEGEVSSDGTLSGKWDDACNSTLTKAWQSTRGKAVFNSIEMFNNNKADYLYAISLINYQETL